MDDIVGDVDVCGVGGVMQFSHLINQLLIAKKLWSVPNRYLLISTSLFILMSFTSCAVVFDSKLRNINESNNLKFNASQELLLGLNKIFKEGDLSFNAITNNIHNLHEVSSATLGKTGDFNNFIHTIYYYGGNIKDNEGLKENSFKKIHVYLNEGQKNIRSISFQNLNNVMCISAIDVQKIFGDKFSPTFIFDLKRSVLEPNERIIVENNVRKFMGGGFHYVIQDGINNRTIDFYFGMRPCLLDVSINNRVLRGQNEQ